MTKRFYWWLGCLGVCAFALAANAEQGPQLFDELVSDPSIVLDPDATMNELPPLGNNLPEPKGMKSAKPKVLPYADSSRTPASEAAPIPSIETAPVSGVPEVIPLQIPPQPQLAGTGLPVPAAPAPVASQALNTPMPPTSTAMPPLPGVPDVAIILSGKQFFPSRIRLKDGIATRLIFSTVNKKPAALVIERLQIQRWIAKEGDTPSENNTKLSKFEVTREISATRTVDITLDPKAGVYTFYDAISGATGEIAVE